MGEHMNQRGTTLLEMVIFSVVASIILLAIGSLYTNSLIYYSQGSAQTFMQRQATMIQEEFARQILPATTIPTWGCGPGAAGFAAKRTSDYLCFYLESEKVFECTITPDDPLAPTSTGCVGTARDLLQGSPVSLKADSFTFTRGAAGGSVDISFTLSAQGPNSRVVADPMQFAMGIRLRNS